MGQRFSIDEYVKRKNIKNVTEMNALIQDCRERINYGQQRLYFVFEDIGTIVKKSELKVDKSLKVDLGQVLKVLSEYWMQRKTVHVYLGLRETDLCIYVKNVAEHRFERAMAYKEVYEIVSRTGSKTSELVAYICSNSIIRQHCEKILYSIMAIRKWNCNRLYDSNIERMILSYCV